MRPPRKLSAVLAGLAVIGGVATTSLYFVLQGSIQPRAGTLSVAGLEAAVEVRYDKWAIPTIVARSERDLFRAQGFVHASERLWQLELFQRIAQGRLSEVFGEEAIDTDRLIRTLDLWGVAEATLASFSPVDRDRLDAYAAGVNAKIRSWRGVLPPEFVLLGIEPQAWTARSSVAIGKLMSLDLSRWRDELNRAGTLARIPAELRATLEPGYPSWGPTIMQDGDAGSGLGASDAEVSAVLASPTPSGASVTSEWSEARPDAAGRWDPVRMLSGLGFHGSNSWALGGSRTADGHPLLANDMHLSLRAPATWFINALHAEEDGLHVAGLSIPGAPGVVVGFNRTLAWGFTNAMLDDGDFTVESVNIDASMYRSGQQWVPFAVREEEIFVRGRDEPVVVQIRETERGPVITDVLPSSGLTLSLLWTGSRPLDASSAIFGMNRARTATQFREALASFAGPHQNVIFATTGGELGYRLAGSIPRRNGFDGGTPISFDLLPDGWEGFWSSDSMPTLVRPSSDFLASANNLQSRALFGIVGDDYPLPFRARRIVDRVSEAREWTVADMVELQLDTKSLWADRLVPRAAAAARRAGETDIADALAGWDRRVTVESREAVWFYAWLYRLRERIAADELDSTGWFSDLALDRVLSGLGERWVDDVRTPQRERLEDLEVEAIQTAIAAAEGRAWGDVHQERSVHPLGQVAWLDWIFRFNVGPYPAPGGRHTVRPDDPFRWGALDATSWRPPYISEYGPSERFVAHLVPGGPTGHFFLPTGQSGNPLDEHYRDMSRLWLAGEMVEVSLDLEEQQRREVSRLRLEPGASPSESP